ncbi:hypothetical protein DOTSEDRAFT_27111 [Dothistroma septosporum NZE10]|uniref:Uncharacterized protein n=1 Tax=Dothistroma septosporum (strain NZE10 / CBS 128990) TaxID=675120 RepID=N1PEB8_DOTSN|nr:hypothetical protein DOTSEDRAFT_27111 [Dothistroma septosporum NZE10]
MAFVTRHKYLVTVLDEIKAAFQVVIIALQQADVKFQKVCGKMNAKIGRRGALDNASRA